MAEVNFIQACDHCIVYYVARWMQLEAFADIYLCVLQTSWCFDCGILNLHKPQTTNLCFQSSDNTPLQQPSDKNFFYFDSTLKSKGQLHQRWLA